MDFFLLYFFFQYLADVSCLSRPSFISQWVLMDSNNVSTTDRVFSHGFGVAPMKVEVQVKSPTTGFIYPGVGSAHGNHEQGYRGGVLCVYNINEVRVLGATNDGSAFMKAFIIYTGNLSWTSGNQEISSTGFVRVRVWHPNDFPPPDYTGALNLKAGNIVWPERESLTHSLGSIPAFTVVHYYQPFIHMGEPLYNWYAEAQGTNAHKGSDPSVKWGALTYAVGPSDLRLWAPSTSSNGLFSFCEGWGSYVTTSCSYIRGTVKVYMWREFPGTTLLQKTGSLSSSFDTDSKEFNTVPGYSVDSDLVSVMYEATSGNNVGYQFTASGAAQIDGMEGCGGVVYGYSEEGDAIRIWYPTDVANKGFIVSIYEMGGNWNNQRSENVSLYINVWKIASPTTSSSTSTTIASTTSSSSTTTSPPTTSITTLAPTTTSTLSTMPTTTIPPSTITTSSTTTSITVSTLATSPPGTSTTSITTTTSLGTTLSTLPTNTITTSALTEPTTIPSPTSSTTSTLGSGVVCFNTSAAMNVTEVYEKVQKMIANLTIATKSTSKYRRSLNCATDERDSSVYIGLVGALFTTIAFSLIVVPDLIPLAKMVVETLSSSTGYHRG